MLWGVGRGMRGPGPGTGLPGSAEVLNPPRPALPFYSYCPPRRCIAPVAADKLLHFNVCTSRSLYSHIHPPSSPAFTPPLSGSHPI